MNGDFFNQTSTERKERLIRGIKSWVGYLAVAVISLTYMFTGYFNLSTTGRTIEQILLSSALSMAVGIGIVRGWAKQGRIGGSKDSVRVKKDEEHIKIVQSAVPYFKYSKEWEDIENANALKDARSIILSRQGLVYDEYFDAEGKFIGKFKEYDKEASKKQRARVRKENIAIEKAIEHKVTPVILTELTSDIKGNLDRNNLGISEKQYELTRSGIEIISRIFFGIMFGLFMLEPILGAGWEAFLYTALQVAFYQVGGAIAYYDRYTFKTTDEVASINKKITLLENLIQFGKSKEMEVKRYGSKSTEFGETERIIIPTDTRSV